MSKQNRSKTAVDVVVIALVPVALAAVHFLAPHSLQRRLAFHYDLSRPLQLLTGSYVHASDGHLLGNVAGYLAAVLVAYQLCLQAGERRWFRATFVAFLVVLPVFVNLADYVIITSTFPTTPGMSRGFSAVAAGFAGFVFVALFVRMRTYYDRSTVFFTAQFVVLLLLTEVLVIYGGIPDPTVLGAVSLGLVLAVWSISGGWASTRERSREAWRTSAIDGVRIALVVVVLSYFVFLLFPTHVVSDRSFTNIYAHGVGFVLGGVISGGTFVILRGGNF